MKKALSHTNPERKKKVLATKKASSSVPANTPLMFKLVSEAELKASRNRAYRYLVK